MIFNADETSAWNARLQQLMRAAQSLGPGGSQFIINAANPMYDDEDGDDGDSPFGRMTATIEDVEGEDSSDDDEPHDDELYVEEDDETVMEESRDAWRALRIALFSMSFSSNPSDPFSLLISAHFITLGQHGHVNAIPPCAYFAGS